MSDALRTLRAGFVLELQHCARSRLFLACTLLGAVNFLALVSLFGLTGSMAPTALIDEDGGVYAQAFVRALRGAHRSFRLRPMTEMDAAAGLKDGRLVAAITIPADFTQRIQQGEVVPIDVRVDNVDVDLADDVQRALPAAIVAFGEAIGVPGVRVQLDEQDTLPHDTGYIPYLVVSGLALDALVVAAILGAIAVARDWEGGAANTWKVWRLAPVSATAVLVGRLLAAAALAAVAIGGAAVIVVAGYGVRPQHPVSVAAALTACVLIFTCLGGLLGVVVRRTQAVVPLVFGLAMPFYLISGALEPIRLDGEWPWRLAHLSPAYYAVGVLQHAFHGLQVTPEPVRTDLLALIAIAGAGLLAAGGAMRRVGGR